MSDLLSGVAGAFIGATAIIGSGLLVESYKNHCNKAAAASAIAGEIFSILDISTRRDYVTHFTNIKLTLEAGTDVKIPNFIGRGRDGKLEPVIEAHLTHIGLFSSKRLPERISIFYTQLSGIRTDIINLAEDVFGNNTQVKAKIIDEDLNLWRDTVKLGRELYDELKAIAEEEWHPKSLVKQKWGFLLQKLRPFAKI